VERRVTIRQAQQTWQELSPHLDIALDLEGEAREAWLSEFESRSPSMAAELRRGLAELAELQQQDFLNHDELDIPGALLRPGQRFDSYTLDERIGQGGMGTVWLGHRSDGRFEGQVAVKLLNSSLIGQPTAEHFVREGSLLARLRHPHIAQLLDAGVTTQDQPYLVLEYVRGVRVDAYCRERKLDVDAVIGLFLDILDAVAHAHSNLVVHRDLKPSNILVTDTGVVKLLDFGVAGMLSGAAGSEVASVNQFPRGLTPSYAAPEQFLNKPATTATDVYALGLLLFVLLTNQHPAGSESRTPADFARQTLQGSRPKASELVGGRLRRQLRGDLDCIVARALCKEPAKRYETAAQFAADLRRHLAHQPVSARPLTMGYELTKFAQRHRTSVIAGVIVLLTILNALTVSLRQVVETGRQRDLAHYSAKLADASHNFLWLLMQTDLGASSGTPRYFERIQSGVDMLHKQYSDDPKFEGRMLAQMANGFRDNGEIRRANPLYQEAYDIGQRHHDAELMGIAQCGRAYGEINADIDEGVMQRLQDGRRLLKSVDASDIDSQTECLLTESLVYARTGDRDRREQLLLEAKRNLEQHDAAHRPMYVEVLSELGEMYLDTSRPAKALESTRLAGRADDENGRGGTTTRLITRQNAAVALDTMGEIGASLVEREIINKKVLDTESPGQEPLTYPMNYAMTLIHMDRPADALQAMKGVEERTRAEDNPLNLTHALMILGNANLQLGRYAEARTQLTEAKRTAESGVGSPNTDALITAHQAQLAGASGDVSSVTTLCNEALKLAGYGSPKHHLSLARVLLICSQAALAQGTPELAEEWSTDALALSEALARQPDSSADVGESLLRLAQARAALGKSSQAAPLLERAVRCLTNGLSADHAITAEAKSALNSLTQKSQGLTYNRSRRPARHQFLRERALAELRVASPLHTPRMI
jgi:eukaryotic-like serine/threonine-protein kinase